jgi:hypothetical protein
MIGAEIRRHGNPLNVFYVDLLPQGEHTSSSECVTCVVSNLKYGT